MRESSDFDSIPLSRTYCPIERTLEIVDSKWTVLLLRELLLGTRRFGEIRRSLPGISPKTLTERLRALEEHGIVRREVFAEVPPRVEYALTEYGHTLRPVLEALARWGAEHARVSRAPEV